MIRRGRHTGPLAGRSSKSGRELFLFFSTRAYQLPRYHNGYRKKQMALTRVLSSRVLIFESGFLYARVVLTRALRSRVLTFNHNAKTMIGPKILREEYTCVNFLLNILMFYSSLLRA